MIRYHFLDDSVKLDSVHPSSIFLKEKDLAKKYLEAIPHDKREMNCPFCGSREKEVLFSRWNLNYSTCSKCWSVFLDPLPNASTLREYFFESELAAFRGDESYQDEVRRLRKGLWVSQSDWIEGRVRRYLGMDDFDLLDWGTKHLGWKDYLEKTNFVKNVSSQEALAPIERGDDPLSQSSILLLFDVIQREADPGALLRKVKSFMTDEGILLITCRSGSGFDILTLREQNESIFPFDHLCLPSVEGIRKILDQEGFEILELTTPGQLDVNLVKNSLEGIPQEQYFQRFLLQQSDSVLERFQLFLQENNLSSHLRVVAKKKKGCS